jgi:glutamate synthase domain-containing protein 3
MYSCAFEVGRGGAVIVLNATFKKFELYRGGQIYWWGKQEFLEKTNELLQVTETLFRTHNFRTAPPLPTSNAQEYI